MKNQSSPNHPSNTKKKLGGLVSLAVGLAFGYYFVYLKVQAMQQHLPEIRYSGKPLIFIPFMLVFGLYYLLFTPAGSGAWKELTPKEKPVFIAALIITLVGVVGLFVWFNSQLTQHGYEGLF